MSIPVIQPEDNDIFSFRFIFSTARRYWLWILAAALLGGTGSYFIFARQGYLYEKTARIMLRDDKQKKFPGFGNHSFRFGRQGGGSQSCE